MLNISNNVPNDVIEFGNKMSEIWSPKDVFVMDICEYNDRYYVIENNCFNCSGLYKCNTTKIVSDIQSYYEEKK